MYQMTVYKIKRNFWRVKRVCVYNKQTRDLQEIVNDMEPYKGNPNYIFTFGDLTGFIQDPWAAVPSASELEDPGVEPQYDTEGEEIPF